MIASKRVPVAYRKKNRVSHLTADAVRQMGYVLEDSGRKLTVGQQRPRRRTQRGGTGSDLEITQSDLDELEDLANLSDFDDDEQQPEPQREPVATTAAERRKALLETRDSSVVMTPEWRAKALAAKVFDPYQYIRLSEARSEDGGVQYNDFDTKFPRMRGDIEAVMPSHKQLAALREYHDYLNQLKRQLELTESNDSDAERIATVGAERDWATSQIQAVRIKQRQEEQAQHDADVAAHHGFGSDPSVGPSTDLHVDDAAASMYASQRGAASPRRHSIDLGAMSPIGTNVGDASSVAAIGALDASVGSLDTSVDQLSKKVEKLEGTTQAAVDTARLATLGVPANQVATVNTIVREDPEIADMVRRGLVKPSSLVYPSYVSDLKRELRQSSAVAVGPDGNQLLNADGRPRYTTSTSQPNTLHRGRIARSRVPVFERTGSIPSRRTPGLKYFRPARASRPDIFSPA